MEGVHGGRLISDSEENAMRSREVRLLHLLPKIT